MSTGSQALRGALLLTPALIVGCGAAAADRSDGAPDADTSLADAGGDAATGCLRCDDRVTCTVDTCVDGECRHEPDDGACEEGRCDPTRGCVACLEDADCDDRVVCTLDRCADGECVLDPDDSSCSDGRVCHPGVGCVVCAADEDCDDGVQCTIDTCVAEACSHEARNMRCPAGTPLCDPAVGCVECFDDSQCDDGSLCNGVDECRDGECVTSAPVDCDDGVACTQDRCVEDAATPCENEPDASACRADERCDPSAGCVATAVFWANTSSALFTVDYSAWPSLSYDRVGSFGRDVTDLALSPEGVLYAAGRDMLHEVNHATGATSAVGIFGADAADDVVGLAFAPDGTLYAVTSNADLGIGALYEVDTGSGLATRIGDLGASLRASGDIVWVPGHGLVTSVPDDDSDQLMTLDTATGAATPWLDPGIPEVYGLTWANGELVGLCGDGRIIAIDLETGAPTTIDDGLEPWWGGS